MKLKKVIEQTSKSDLSRARGRLIAHSSRDYSQFLKQLSHFEDTFKNLGYVLEAKKIDT